ncbi:zinc phosphodiesterase ELAC protein 1 [Callorhinchus milii]|uniref:ElaC ribonuclease Z 1 n=1 Tax=Callorhinchus milii TaxID=7868 RepID=A0A4W3J0R9_CALMI|nr:zinc phosphodiesterase ELAC protein 1 [Callorhinchus milii]|eukprot:gi/632976756/ref/XP_007904972.1/ PREDICTED: zinc phosphodiesterase ELAC protein 1 [Callorhinchus milii]
MAVDLTFLGTGAAFPSRSRGASAVAWRHEGECWLFDCGEGTQTQVLRSALRAGKISKVFITHLHGDHLFGLPGLLCTVSLQCSSTSVKQPLEIYGPVGLRKYLRTCLGISQSQLNFPYVVHELIPTQDQCFPEEWRYPSDQKADDQLHPQEQQGKTIHLDPQENCYHLLDHKHFTVKAFKLFHRIPSFGFVIEEKERPGRLLTQKLKDMGVHPGPLYGKLKNGQAITLDNGETVFPMDVLEGPVPGRKICILGDCSGIVGDVGKKLCLDADVLVHEATLDDSQADKAKEHGHCTPKTAAEFAKSCKVKRLVLTHFSQRYKPASLINEGDDNVLELKTQAELILEGQEVTLAEDFLVLEIPSKKKPSNK